MSKGIVLILGGIGVKGVANIGVLQSLSDHKIDIAEMVTSGVSSLIGARFALGRDLDLLTERFIHFFNDNERYLWGLEQLAGIVRETKGRIARGFSYFLRERLFCRNNISRVSILSWDVIQRELDEFFGNMTFSDLKIPLSISAIDLNLSTEVLIQHGDLVNSLKSSIAFPGLFPPVCIADHELISSTLYCELPLGCLLRKRHPIVAIDIPSSLPSKRPESSIEILSQMDEVRGAYIKHILSRKVDRIFRLDEIERFQWSDYKEIPELITVARQNMNRLTYSQGKGSGVVIQAKL